MLLMDLMLVVIDVLKEELILGLAGHHSLAKATHAGNWPRLIISHHVANLLKPDIGSCNWFSSHQKACCLGIRWCVLLEISRFSTFMHSLIG